MDNSHSHEEETSRRFYTKQHKAYCGIDLQARTMSLCILSQEGERLLHCNMQTSPDTFLKAIAPYRADLVVAVAWIFTWYWLADLCARAGIPCVLGHALDMQAIHGGKAKKDQSDAQQLAIVLRGAMLPQAYGSPAEMRATRALWRRRLSLRRQRADLLTHLPQPKSPYHLPALGKQLAYTANRAGVAERFAEPAGQNRIAVDLALISH